MRHIPTLDSTDLGEVVTVEQAANYYQRVQRHYYRGVPGVGLAAESFARLRPLLDGFRAATPADAAGLWVLSKGGGAMLIATHLHNPSPGRALVDFLARQPLDDLGQRFASRWMKIVEYYAALRCLYVLSEAPDLESVLPETTER